MDISLVTGKLQGSNNIARSLSIGIEKSQGFLSLLRRLAQCIAALWTSQTTKGAAKITAFIVSIDSDLAISNKDVKESKGSHLPKQGSFTLQWTTNCQRTALFYSRDKVIRNNRLRKSIIRMIPLKKRNSIAKDGYYLLQGRGCNWALYLVKSTTSGATLSGQMVYPPLGITSDL